MMRSISSSPILLWIRRKLLWILLFVSAAILLVHIWPSLFKLHWRLDWSWYDLGFFGLVPLKSYHSFNHSTIDVNFLRQDQRCTRDYLFLASRGSGTEPGANIFDHNGELIWRQPRMGDETHDFRTQTYKGKQYLTFWSGKPDKGGKVGSWYMMDETYSIKYNITPAAGYTYGDMHEFQLTEKGTALVTVYPPIPADLTAFGGAKEGYVLDGVFQEIELETGNLLFQWNASSQIPLDASRKTLDGCSDQASRAFLGCGNKPDAAFDYYHINSVQKDENGNYLVSGRHTSSLTYVNGTTGQTIWTLGGKQNDFEYEPQQAESLFSWQHHARIHNGSRITLLDNNAYSYLHPRTESRGLELGIDATNRKATISREYRHPQKRMSYSQGNVQVLEDTGNVLVGWGNCAAFTEFSAEGEVLCDARFAPAAFFSFQPLSSYRTFRGRWIGKPSYPPSAVLDDEKVYVSWNGATEVARWRLEALPKQDRVDQKREFEALVHANKTGFETTLPAKLNDHYESLRVAALDKNDEVLALSGLLYPDYGDSWLSALEKFIFMLITLATFGVASLYVIFILIRSKRSTEKEGYERVEMAE